MYYFIIIFHEMFKKTINETTLSKVNLLITSNKLKLSLLKQVIKLCYEGRLIERQSALESFVVCGELFWNVEHPNFLHNLCSKEWVYANIFSSLLSFLQSSFYTVCFTKSQRQVTKKLLLENHNLLKHKPYKSSKFTILLKMEKVSLNLFGYKWSTLGIL